MDEIKIETYSSEWTVRFDELGRQLRGGLGDVALRIDHIGSTAIRGMAAKPVVDIQISVASLDALDGYRLPMEAMGFVYQPENPERTKRYFREAPGSRRTHIHVRENGSWSQQMALIFRDYLRNNPVDADLYAAEKHRLASMYSQNRIAYVEGKTKVIWEILYRADRWVAAMGWRPGDSDA